jgi:hypothetical protein
VLSGSHPRSHPAIGEDRPARYAPRDTGREPSPLEVVFGFYRPPDRGLAFGPAVVFCGARVEGIESFQYPAPLCVYRRPPCFLLPACYSFATLYSQGFSMQSPFPPNVGKVDSERSGYLIGPGLIHAPESLYATTTCSPLPRRVISLRSHPRDPGQAIYARSCIRTSQNTPSTHLGE